MLFKARTSRYTLALTARSLAFTTGRAETSRMVFAGARSDAKVSAAEPAHYRVNYFDGSGPDEWRTDIPTAKAVVYQGLYSGVDLKVYGVERLVEYDWIVRADADPEVIAVAIEGGSARINEGGAVSGFRVGPYDRSCGLVIDPTIIGYSTYVGTG